MERNSILTGSIITLLALSAFLLAIAPLFMPEGYSWRIHTISESAAQGLHNAWIARLGLACYGLATLVLARKAKGTWPPVTRYLIGLFSVCLFLSAIFSHRPWLPDTPASNREDLLHSIAAGVMGTAFCFAVAWRLFTREQAEKGARVFDLVVVLVAILVSIFLGVSSDANGVAQRTMFICSYIWFAREALGIGNSETVY